MKDNYLFPHRFRIAGWCLFVPSAILGIILLFNDTVPRDGSLAAFLDWPLLDWPLLDEVVMTVLVAAFLLVTFSREKDEDECIDHIRMKSLAWAFILDSALLVAGTWLFYDFAFMTFLLVYIFMMYFLFGIIYFTNIYRFRHANEK